MDVKLPGYFGISEENYKLGALLIHRMEMMSHFKNAIKSSWFKEGLRHLETFQTINGSYNFPINYLAEKEGYWVSAAHMRLGENRKSRLANELESTFWMMKIRKLTEMT